MSRRCTRCLAVSEMSPKLKTLQGAQRHHIGVGGGVGADDFVDRSTQFAVPRATTVARSATLISENVWLGNGIICTVPCCTLQSSIALITTVSRSPQNRVAQRSRY